MNGRRFFLSYSLPGALALLGSSAHGARAPSKESLPTGSGITGSAVLALQEKAAQVVGALKEAEVKAHIPTLATVYHKEAVLVEPTVLQPAIVGKDAIIEARRRALEQKRKPLYFYLRQAKVLVTGTGRSALMVSNYEQGEDVAGKLVETNGKAMFTVLQLNDVGLVSGQVLVPNLSAGTYGPLGTAISAKPFGIYPVRAIGQVATQGQLAGSALEKQLIANTEQINSDWVEGNIDKLLGNYNMEGAFSVGDFGPFYLSGIEEVRKHFEDFYATAKVTYVKAVNPVVRVYDDIATVAFQFDSELVVHGKKIRSPGKGVYVFSNQIAAATTAPTTTPDWRMAGCVETSIVAREIGDPYPS